MVLDLAIVLVIIVNPFEVIIILKLVTKRSRKIINPTIQKSIRPIIENDIKADIVIPVPDSGVPAALGYAEYSKKKFELGLIRNHYVGRTFIEPAQNIRILGVKLKLSSTKSVVKNK